MLQDAEDLKDLEIHASVTDKQMALFASADKDASRLNSVVFSSVRNDVVQMDDQFSK